MMPPTVRAVAPQSSLALAPRGDGEQICGPDGAARRSACRRRAGAVRGCLSRSAPLFAQLGPIFEAFFDLALEAALWGIVEVPATERFGEIILTGERIRRVMIVGVTGAVAFLLHQPRRRVEDVLGRQQRAGLFRRTHGFAERGICSV